ncbi:MAG: hypothetical protein U0105_18765 [Candidatus Obscuribacterales bacterium]
MISSRAVNVVALSLFVSGACVCLSGCGGGQPTANNAITGDPTVTTTVSPDKSTETTVIDSGGGAKTTMVTKSSADGTVQEVDSTMDSGDGTQIKMHGKSSPDGKGDVELETPGGVKVHARGNGDGSTAKVTIDGLGDINVDTDRNGNSTIVTPFGKVTAPAVKDSSK